MTRDTFTGILSWEREEEYAQRVKGFVDESLVTYKLSDKELEKYRSMSTPKKEKPSMLTVVSMRRKS